jgi:hypothetical protein
MSARKILKELQLRLDGSGLCLFAPLPIITAHKEVRVPSVFRCRKNLKTSQEAFRI